MDDKTKTTTTRKGSLQDDKTCKEKHENFTQTTTERLSKDERNAWIRAIWDHYFSLRKTKTPTDFSDCLRATIALLLNRESDEILAWDHDGGCAEVAWRNHHSGFNGEFSTEDWDFLSVSGFHFAIGHDGCP